jgi:O-antigen/teichoic acid export membrane protein
MVNRQALNIAANFSGVGARLLFALAFNIIYFRLLGSEGFGLIGFYTSLAALSALFDLGLGQTTMREVARREASGEAAAGLRSVVFTLQILLTGVGLVLGLLIALTSPWIATWFSTKDLGTDEVRAAVLLMGAVLTLQFPVNFFYGALIGLQRQLLSNTLLVAATALRGIISIVALFIWGAAPAIFFTAQIAASIIELTAGALTVWRLLPASSGRTRFEAGLLRETWQFTSGTWLAVTFAQTAVLADKLILSALLPLHLYGLYSLAVTVTTALQRLAPPFTNALFPHFVRLIQQGETPALSRAYTQASQAASAIFLAAGLALTIYAAPLAHLLATDAADANRIAVLLALLAAANTLNVELALPFSLLFAHGITSIALRINFVLCVAYLASLILLAPRYGVDAAAGLWLAANAVMLPALLFMTHRAVLPGLGASWLVRVLLLPGIAAAAVLLAGYAAMPALPKLATLIWIAFNAAFALAAALCAAPSTRQIVAAVLSPVLHRNAR